MIYPGSLHNHTCYSNFRLRDSINRIDKLIDRAIELGHSCVAITEHETVASHLDALKYYEKVKADHPDFKVILGNEIYLVRNGLDASNFNKEWDKYYHFILLAKDKIGWQQLCELSTRAWMRAYNARGMWRVPTYYQDLVDIIGANPGHIIGSTACIGGALGTQLLRVKDGMNELYPKVEQWLMQMRQIFGKGDFYLEMQPSNDPEQVYVNHEIIKLAEKWNLPYIITNDAHYLKKEDLKIEKIFLNAQGGDREAEKFYATTYLMGTDEVARFFKNDEKVLNTAFTNIEEIKNKCEDYDIRKPLKIPELPWETVLTYYTEYPFYFEKMPTLQKFLDSEHKADKYLVNAVIHGIKTHKDLQNDEAYQEIELCLQDTWISSQVNKAEWSAYFLNLQKIIKECWRAGTICGPGRGSGVGFLLLYVLDITQINPLREKTKTFRFRFLNPERVSVLDIDTDISGKKRGQVLEHLRKVYGQDRVANVLTLGTEKSKSAIQSAARGLGIDNDIAAYLSSMIESDRGQLRTLAQTYYGDEENGFPANAQFKKEMDENYPELWEAAQAIEGLIVRCGIHAGGIIFVDEPFTNSCALMRAPSGEVITQFDLHAAEELSLIKYDMLSVEGLDRIQTCIDLLCDYGYAERKDTLQETYENIIGIYNLERDNPEMWKLLCQHKVQSLFQMEGQTGIQGIESLQPTSVDDLAVLNSTLRLMAQKKGDEMPTEKLARFKKNPRLWIEETDSYGLTQQDRNILWPVLSTSYGLCIAQEQFMQLVQLPELGGFSLSWADKLRKAIAKKNPKDYNKLTTEFYEITKEKGISQNLAHYVWDVLIAMSRGYGFNQSHTLAYSLIALQELNLAYKYPIIFWNTACLITDSGGDEEVEESEDDDEEEKEEVKEEYTSEVEEFVGETDDDEDDSDDDSSTATKKKQTRTANYGKIATAIGKMKAGGISVAPPNINKSTFTFSPDVEANEIRFGLSGITRVGKDLINTIIARRPYKSLEDFTNRVKLNVLQMTALIKAGAFDCFGERSAVMKEYIYAQADCKKRITLQNLKMLFEFGLIPDEYDFVKRCFYFGKYLKKLPSYDESFVLDDIAFQFWEKNLDLDLLMTTSVPGTFRVKKTVWDNIWKAQQNKIRPYVQAHNQELLEAVNNKLVGDTWNKYCSGSYSKWEMDSVGCYFHDHELKGVHLLSYDVSDFFKLPEEPEVESYFRTKSGAVPLFKIRRIAGTVLDRDKNKKLVSLLTENGVVTVKIFGAAFTNYDRQLSEMGEDGHKHVKEKSWLARGNKLIITGIRRGDSFVAKKYARTPYHLVEKIVSIDDEGYVSTVTEREGVDT